MTPSQERTHNGIFNVHVKVTDCLEWSNFCVLLCKSVLKVNKKQTNKFHKRVNFVLELVKIILQSYV